MYPPKFNLRHFMSHLAPGGYYFIQLLYFVVFIIWVLYPTPINVISDYLTNNNGIVLTFAFLIFGVFCYFVGVVLRLPSVDIINNLSIETNIRKKYYEIKYKQFFDKTKVNVIICACFQVLLLLWKIIYFLPSPITTKRAYTKLLDIIKTFEKKGENSTLVDGLSKELEKTDANLKDILLQDFIRQKSVNYLEMISGITYREYVNKYSDKSEYKWILDSLWAVDRFPYPLWIITKTYQIAKAKEENCSGDSDFQNYVWPELIITMRGSISDRTYSTVPFNRCKLYVKSRSAELASDLYDREAITRMMAGFHQGLRLGSFTTSFVCISSVVLLTPVKHLLKVPLQESNNIDMEKTLICLAIIALFFFLFNRYHQLKIEENFHMLRMSESEAVFESYIIAKTLPAIQNNYSAIGEY